MAEVIEISDEEACKVKDNKRKKGKKTTAPEKEHDPVIIDWTDFVESTPMAECFCGGEIDFEYLHYHLVIGDIKCGDKLEGRWLCNNRCLVAYFINDPTPPHQWIKIKEWMRFINETKKKFQDDQDLNLEKFIEEMVRLFCFPICLFRIDPSNQYGDEGVSEILTYVVENNVITYNYQPKYFISE